MDWNYLFTRFDGRIGRQAFWIGVGVLLVAQIVANLVMTGLFGDGAVGGFLAMLVSLALVYPSLAVLVKRFHDRGKSGWWSLISLIPIVGAIWIIVDAGILPGTPGANAYGADPLGGAAAQDSIHHTSFDSTRDHHFDHDRGSRSHDRDSRTELATSSSGSDGGPSGD